MQALKLSGLRWFFGVNNEFDFHLNSNDLEEKLDDMEVAFGGCDVQGCSAVIVALVHINLLHVHPRKTTEA